MIWRLWVQSRVRATFLFYLRQCWQDPATIWQEKTNYRKTRLAAVTSTTESVIRGAFYAFDSNIALIVISSSMISSGPNSTLLYQMGIMYLYFPHDLSDIDAE